MKDIARQLLTAGLRFLDSDGDGNVEIADLPGALAKAASWQATGLALVKSGVATFESLKAAASAGQLTSGGVTITAEQVDAAWEEAKKPFHTAADEARAELAKDAH